MNIEAKGCVNCPFLNSHHDDEYGWNYDCNHPNGIDIAIIEKGEAPFDCPLKKESITITLKEDNPQ